jgi:hypothetical protein
MSLPMIFALSHSRIVIAGSANRGFATNNVSNRISLRGNGWPLGDGLRA